MVIQEFFREMAHKCTEVTEAMVTHFFNSIISRSQLPIITIMMMIIT